MPIETVRFRITGANPGVTSIPVVIDGTGSGNASVTVTGGNVGVDTVQAFIDTKNLSSNQAIGIWQAPNGPISVGPVAAYVGNGDGSGTFPNGLSSANLTGPQYFSSLMFNSHPQSIFPSDPHQSGNQANPFTNNGISTSGIYTGDTAVQGVSGSFNMSLVGSFVVANAGQISFSAYVNSAFVLAIPGATLVSGQQSFNGISATPMMGYAPTVGSNGAAWPGGSWAQWDFTVNFPAPGVYNFECLVVTGTFGERQFCLLANGQPIPSVALTANPGTPAAGTGDLQLTPTLGGPGIQGNTLSFNLQISGLTFSSTPYVPLFEGTAGQLYIADANDGSFQFPPLPSGAAVDNASAVALFSLAGSSNSSYQNRLSIQPTGGGYKLAYNGSAVDPGIESTQVQVAYQEIAWYNPTTRSFDTYTPSSLGGGSKVSVQVNWLVQPSIVSVSPSTLPGNGGSYTITVTLAKPMPPVQANVNADFFGSGGLNVTGSSANLLSNGFLAGWTVDVTTSVVSGSVNAALNLTASDTITYLSGDSFVTNAVTYINAQIATVQLS